MFTRKAPESWAASARQTMEDARDALGDAGDRARQGYHEMADQARQGYHDIRDQARRGYRDMSRGAQRAWSDMEDAAGPYRDSFESAVSSNPLKAIVASLAVGVLVGWLIKRS